VPAVNFVGGPLDGLRMDFEEGREPSECEFRVPCLPEGASRFAQYAAGDDHRRLHHYQTFSEPQLVSPQHCFDVEVVGWLDRKGYWAEVAGKRLKVWAVVEELTGGF
jgi:hypothetical protein